jgi:hypothetical protein
VKEERRPGQEVGILSVGAEMRRRGARGGMGRGGGPKGDGREAQLQWVGIGLGARLPSLYSPDIEGQ